MNPLLQAMSRPTGGGNGNSIAGLAQMLRSGNPQQIAMNMMQSNPQFRAFMQSVQGKSPQQFCQERGLDFSQISSQIR